MDELSPAFLPLGLTAVDSADAYYKYFPQCDGWNGWVACIAKAKDPTTEKPLFSICVCINKTVGKITAQLVKGFIQQGKTVLYYSPRGEFVGVNGIVEHDAENWKFGWEINLDR